MKPRTYPQVWKKLDAETRARVADLSGVSIGYLKVIATPSKGGRCGRYVARDIARAVAEIKGRAPDDVLAELFPDHADSFGKAA